MIESSTGQLRKDSKVEGVVNLPSAADDVRVSIYSPSGAVVKTIDMGYQAGGTAEFSWDGSVNDGSVAAPGKYIIKAEARYGRETYSQDTWVKERIDSVTLGDGLQGIKLNMADDSEITLGQVKKIL